MAPGSPRRRTKTDSTQCTVLPGDPPRFRWPNGEITDSFGNAINPETSAALDAVGASDVPRSSPSGQLEPTGQLGVTSNAWSGLNYSNQGPGGTPMTATRAQGVAPRSSSLSEADFLAKSAEASSETSEWRRPDLRTEEAVSKNLKKLATLQSGKGGGEFQVHQGWFFEPGRVFRLKWSEPVGTTASNSPASGVYTTLRPMVVVYKHPAHCICVPVYSNGGQGVAKPGLKASEIQRHAILHMDDKVPRLTPDEQQFESSLLDPFPVESYNGSTLSKTSRVRFDMAYTVRFNLKVCNLGMIKTPHKERLATCFERAN